MQIRSKSTGGTPSSQASGQRRGKGSRPRLWDTLWRHPATDLYSARGSRSGGSPCPRQCQIPAGSAAGPGAWREPTDLGAGLLSGRLRCAGSSRVLPTSEHERWEPRCRSLTHRPTDRPTTSGATGGGRVWSPRDGGGDPRRHIPRRPLLPPPSFPGDRPPASPPPSPAPP